jgi:hypothetical protein
MQSTVHSCAILFAIYLPFVVTSSCIIPTKPTNDEREYRVCELNNKLQYVIISDPESNFVS